MNDLQRFMTRVNKNGPTSYDGTKCWVWLGSVRGKYGQFWYKRKNWKTHRAAYTFLVGTIGRYMVLHTCDNPICVNTDHLKLGTHSDNMADKTARGRSATGDRNRTRKYPERLVRGDQHHARLHPETRQGEKNGNAVLLEQNIKEIRSAYAVGISRADLSRKYKVTWRTINLIVQRKLWPNVH